MSLRQDWEQGRSKAWPPNPLKGEINIKYMKRYAQIVALQPEAEARYRELHLAVWPSVLKTIKDCNIENYSIFLRDGLLFAYFEYTGTDYAADMAKMAADPETQRWWKETDPLQRPLETCKEGEWWAPMEEVFPID